MYQVLIIEDDPMVAMINEQYIRQNKHFKIAGICKDGNSALKFLEDHPVDLLILDVYMPHLDGFETLRQIRKKQISVEAIMVTAANDREALEEALHLGIVDYLVKPFTHERFQIALEKYRTQKEALKDFHTLNQHNIDYIIANKNKNSESIQPKGIQKSTMQILLQCLREHPGVWMTGDEIAKQVGLTGVTVRRYMHYLMESGSISGEMNYETGGRPCMKYKINA